jgi:hypothetical protein
VSQSIDIIVKDRATTGLAKLAAAVEADALNDVVGESATREVQKNFTELDAARPNQMGGRRTHFYADAGGGTSYRRVPDGAVVSIVKDGIRVRIMGTAHLPGGAIRPVNVKKLTIPARAEAYGRSAREFDDLVPLYRRNAGRTEAFALAQAEAQPVSPGKKRKDGTTVRGKVRGGAIMFWLVSQSVQGPDPTVIPSDQRLMGAVHGDLDAYFALLRGEVIT